jgi:hypothetical protein
MSWTLGAPALLRRAALTPAFGDAFDHEMPGADALGSSGMRYNDERLQHPWARP